MRFHRHLFLSSVLLSSLIALAQDKPKPAPAAGTPTDFSIKSSAELVQVPVVVRRSGAHVADLKPDDFTLTQDGKAQKITDFQEIRTRDDAPKSAFGINEFSNYGPEASAKPITIIVIDTVNTPVMDQAYLKVELTKFFTDAIARGDSFGLVALDRSGVHVLHDLNTDVAVMRAAAEKLKSKVASKDENNGNILQTFPGDANPVPNVDPSADPNPNADPNGSPNHALAVWSGLRDVQESVGRFQNRASRISTLAAMQQLAQALAGLPGRKALVWVSSGFQFADGMFQTQGGLNRVFVGASGEALDQNVRTWQLLNAANIVVYPVDARRVTNTAYEVMNPENKYSARYADKEAARDRDREVISGFQAIAEKTGGKPCFSRTDLHNCFKEAVEESHDYYLLSFYVDKKNTDPGWHKINVKLSQKATVRFRPGYLYAGNKVQASEQEKSRNNDLQLAIASPLSYTALPFQGAFKQKEGPSDGKSAAAISDETKTVPGNKKIIEFVVVLPPSSVSFDENDPKMNLDIVAVARNKAGEQVAQVAQKLDRPLKPENVAAIQKAGITYRNKLELPPGEYGVWFVLRDNLTARVGSVVKPLNVTP